MTENKRNEIRDISRNAYIVGFEAGFKEGRKRARHLFIALAVWAVIITAFVALTGCTPFVEYEHLSRPNVANDGYDLGCFGVEHDRGRVVLEGALCENFARSGDDTYARANIKLRLSD